MIVSDARREANRRNGAKSSGPKSAEGKAQARRNALKHGLTATTLPAIGPEAERIRADRLAEWRVLYAPADGWQSWLIDELVGVSLRLGRIEQVEAQLRDLAACRAGADLWDEDRRLEVEKTGAGLGRRPSQVVALLRQTPHGCDWLIARWAGLARIADGSGDQGWTDDQARLAHDLLGTPATSRVGPVGRPITAEGRIAAPAPRPAALARAQIAELQALRVQVAEVDAIHRHRVEAGWDDVPNREVATIRRYERATRNRLYWLMHQIKEAGLHARTRPVPIPIPIPIPVDPPAPKLVAPALEVPPPLTSPPLEVSPPRVERNEPIPAHDSDETNPLSVEPVAAPLVRTIRAEPILPTPPARNRPDLARIARRDARRHRRSA